MLGFGPKMQTQVLGVLPHGCPVQAVIRVLHVGQYLHPQEEGIPQQASADPAGGRKDGIRGGGSGIAVFVASAISLQKKNKKTKMLSHWKLYIFLKKRYSFITEMYLNYDHLVYEYSTVT